MQKAIPCGKIFATICRNIFPEATICSCIQAKSTQNVVRPEIEPMLCTRETCCRYVISCANVFRGFTAHASRKLGGVGNVCSYHIPALPVANSRTHCTAVRQLYNKECHTRLFSRYLYYTVFLHNTYRKEKFVRSFFIDLRTGIKQITLSRCSAKLAVK